MQEAINTETENTSKNNTAKYLKHVIVKFIKKQSDCVAQTKEQRLRKDLQKNSSFKIQNTINDTKVFFNFFPSGISLVKISF